MSSNYDNLKSKNSSARQVLTQGATVTVVDREQWNALLQVLDTNAQMIDSANNMLESTRSEEHTSELQSQR